MSVSASPMEFVVTKMEMEGDEEIPEDGINMSIINELKARRHLWDSRHKLYKDSAVKNRSWTEVARKLGVREPFLKTRWRSLRDRYMKERRREIQIKKRGIIGEYRKNRPWTLMPVLGFLNKATPRGGSALDIELNKPEEEEEEVIEELQLDALDPLNPDDQHTGVQTAAQNLSTYLIINPDNTIQCLPGVQIPSANPRPLRRIEPATSESPRNVTIKIPPTSTVASSSTMSAQVQQVSSIKTIPRLAPAPIVPNRKPEVPQSPETESSERYFYLSIAKEMENHSTRARLKMRKIISDALLKLYEEEESQKDGLPN